MAICLLFVFIAGFAGTYVQFLKGELLDTALDGISAGVLRLAIAFFAAIAVEMASFYGYDYFRGRFSVANKKSLRSLYFDWLLMRSPVEAMAVQQGEFVAQYTDQIDQVNESYLDNIPLLIEISSKTLIVSAALFWLDYRVALLTLFLLTMPLYIPKLIEKRLQNAKNESIGSFQKHLGNIVEWLSGFELIKNYSIEKVIARKFRESNEEVSEKLFRFKKVTYLSKTITALLSYMSHFIVIVATAALVLNGDFSAGDFFIAVGLIDHEADERVSDTVPDTHHHGQGRSDHHANADPAHQVVGGVVHHHQINVGCGVVQRVACDTPQGNAVDAVVLIVLIIELIRQTSGFCHFILSFVHTGTFSVFSMGLTAATAYQPVRNFMSIL